MLIIVGSRRDGNSLKLAKKIKSAFDNIRLHTEIIVPGNQKIHICTGCMDCDKDGICGFTDDMKSNIEKIKNEKDILFITPTRWNILSGDLKIFMDRLNPLFSTRGLKGKNMIAVSIGAKSDDLYSTEAALTSLISFAEASGMNVILDKKFNNCLNSDDILSQQTEIDNFINELKNKINC